MTRSFSFDLMLSDEGGMIICDEGRTSFGDDDGLNRELGIYITSMLMQQGEVDARVTINIETKDGTDQTRPSGDR